MKIANLNKELLRVGWVVNQLPASVKPAIDGLSASFFVKATFRIENGKDPVPWEKGPDFVSGDVFIDDDPGLGVKYASDFVPYKPNGEFAVVGTAYNPVPTTNAFPIRARVGSIARTFNVFGNRRWIHRGAGVVQSDPEPVSEVKLTYANAWGGPGFEPNPIGRGRETDLLPNFENPQFPVVNRGSNVQPAGLGPIPGSWEIRRQKLGTYDKAWLDEHWPWMPHDFDWSYFNASPPAQWNQGYFVGDEDLEFLNLHRDHRVYRCRLPGLLVRCFMTRTVGDSDRFGEIDMDLDTVWVDLDAGKLILVWRGRSPVATLKLAKVRHLLFLAEPIGAPPRDYRAMMDEEFKPREAPKPRAVPSPDFEGVVAAVQARLAGALAKSAELEAQAMQLETQALARLEQTKAGSGGMAASAKSLPDSLVVLRDKLAASAKAGGIPDAQRDEVLRGVDEAQAVGDPEKAALAEKAAIEAQVAAMLAATAPKPKPEVPKTPELLEKAKTEGFVGADLSGADFSGLDLGGMDFTRAVLAKASFRGASLVGAKLIGANLSGADLEGTDFSEADLSGADLKDAKVAGAVWARSILRKTRMSGLAFGAADFRGAVGDWTDFRKAKLTGALFHDANLPRAAFSEATLTDAQFLRARLQRADFAGSSAVGSDFSEADLTAFRGGNKADFSGAVFFRIQGRESIWKGALIDDANFEQSVLVRGQFTECSACGTNFDRCDLRKCTFEDAILQRAVLTNANLLHARMIRADLTEANLDDSNLYDVGLWDAKLLHATWNRAITSGKLLAR